MEIFDPISSSFSYGTDMLYRRQEFDVIKLLDGRILVSGGFGGPRFHPDNGIIASTEIFDPITNTWSLGPEMTQGRMQHKMTLLSNGDVLVVGGITPFNPFDSIPSVDIIHVAENPNDMTVEFIGNLPKSRGRQAQVLARNGKVIIIGGEYLETLIPEQSGAFISEALDSIVIFDPITKTLSNSLAKVHKRFHHFAHELENGDILIYGGLNHRSDTGQPELRVQRYNPFTDSISNVGLNKYVREWGNSFAFAYGKDQVILAGGLEYRTSAGSNYTTVLDSETWSTASNRFYKTSNSLNARWEACALPYATNGGGMILGGRLGDVLRNTEEYSYE
jgi:hypothetical protein